MPTKSDSKIFVKFARGRLVAIISTHVGDIKGASETEARLALVRALQSAFGEIKVLLIIKFHVAAFIYVYMEPICYHVPVYG